MSKFCTHCGKELFDQAIICPDCGCSVQEQKPAQQDYQKILQKTKLFVVIGSIFMALGFFAWIGTSLLDTLYVVIGEQIQANILGMRPTLSMYATCETLASWSSIVFFLVAEIMYIIPREKFNSAFKKENYVLLTQNKAAYKQAAKEKNQELNKDISCYHLSWVLAIVSCVLFVISVFIPSLGL